MRTIIIKGLFLGILILAAPIGLCLASDAHAGAIHDYTITIDADLERLAVEARFAAPVEGIAARSRDAHEFLDAATDCDTDTALRTRGRRLVLPRGGVQCLAYSVHLRRASRTERVTELLDPGNVVVSPTVWLWKPNLHGNDKIRARFELPPEIDVSVPWQPIDREHKVFTLGESPRSGDAAAIFGEFESAVESVAGAEIRIAFLNTQTNLDTALLSKWIRDTAENVAQPYGRFPNPSPRVIVIPVGSNPWGGNSAVPFGRVVRDGGETIELLINERRPIDEFYTEWTPTHEFSHLLLPYLTRQQRWVSEGFASYYQNILLTRAGQYSELQGWQKLYAGFERGRESVPTLSPNAAASGAERNTRMKIYWSGAALALIADVELRRRSAGQESLDTALDRLQQCCLPSDRVWTGKELFTHLDSLLEEPIFLDLYQAYADTAGFPDVRPLLLQLGVVPAGNSIRLTDLAELADVRRAMMATGTRD